LKAVREMADRAYCSHGNSGLSHEIIKKYSSYIISITHDLCCTNAERIFPENIAWEIYTFSTFGNFVDVKMQKSFLIAEQDEEKLYRAF